MVLRLLTKKNTIWRFYVIDDALTQKKNGYLNKAFPGRVLACSALEERLTDMPMYFPIFRGNEGGILWQRQWDPAATSVHTHVLRTCHTTATRTPFTPLLLPPLLPLLPVLLTGTKHGLWAVSQCRTAACQLGSCASDRLWDAARRVSFCLLTPKWASGGNLTQRLKFT